MTNATSFALRARWVLPVEMPPIDGGVVTIAGDRIVAVGTQPQSDLPVQDLGDVVLLPGLVNAHTHLEFSQLAQPLGHSGLPLPEWIRRVIGNRGQQAEAESGIAAGLRESLRAGVTTLGEIATSNPLVSPRELLPDWIAFQEVIGFSAGRVESVFADLANRLRNCNNSHRWGISPHAPYTVHPRLLERLVALARAEHLPVAMHLAESREELQLLRDNAGPFRELLEERSMWDDSVFAQSQQPLDYLRRLAEAPRSLVIHGNYLSPSEIEFIAAQRGQMFVVYCPRTHAYFEHEPYPLAKMMSAGVQMALGTDSRASNPDLSLLAEMRQVARTHADVAPEQILPLGTLDSAVALGLDQSVGSLAPGKLANLIAIRLDLASASPVDTVLQSEQPAQQIWLRGQLVLDDMTVS